MMRQSGLKMAKKLKVGIFSLTSCSGCQVRMLDLEDNLLDIFKLVDIVHFPLLMNKDKPVKQYDVAFVEGAVTTDKQLKEIMRIRKKSKILIALGTCATYGGIPSIKDYGYTDEIEKTVYPDPVPFVHSLGVCGVYPHVKVDYFLRGCPPEKEEILRVLLEVVIGKKVPRNIDDPVCIECRAKENECLLQKGELCMGPITYGGCGALCPSNNGVCYGCRGPFDDANVHSLLKLFENSGVSEEDIRRMFIKFAGTSKKFREARNLCKIKV